MVPRYGFNFQWIFSQQKPEQAPQASQAPQAPQEPDERALDFMAGFGLDFVRIPSDYRFWTRDFEYFEPEEETLSFLDRYLQACRSRGLHMSLNLHRAPGYCINRNDLERDNLWTDAVAQDGFVFLWEAFARRYKGVPSDTLSFDLVNEPPNEGQYGMTRANHEAVMRRTVAAIRSIDPSRQIVIDGIGGGHRAIPELADLGAIHSGRGYQPFTLTHYKAEWAKGAQDWPVPVYPGKDFRGKQWDKDALRESYQPWREVQAKGVTVHVGEFGCYRHTPDDVALRWHADLLSLFKEFGWGSAFWTFSGPFGIIEHGRPGAVYEDYGGYRVDRRLLDLFLESRVPSRPRS
jgi:aryl-phospho-beta-D-glucosidase BglC (GH1 family)